MEVWVTASKKSSESDSACVNQLVCQNLHAYLLTTTALHTMYSNDKDTKNKQNSYILIF